MRSFFTRILAPLLLAAALLMGGGCERRPIGVDFSVDRDFDFDGLRRVAIVDPPEPARSQGLERILVDAASDALGSRFVVVYGNRLRTALDAAGAAAEYGALRQQLAAGRDPDPELLRKVARAIGVDGFYITELATLERRFQPGYDYATVMTSTSSGFSTISQTHATTAVTTVRLTARLFDATTGLTVWSGSKFYESGLNLDSTGLKPIFLTVSEDFLLTLPSSRSAGAGMRMFR